MSNDLNSNPTPIEQDKLLEKFDTESRFRKLDKKEIAGRIVQIICIAFSIFHLYTAWTGPLVTLMHRAVHTAVVMGLIYLLYPGSKKASRKTINVADWILGILSFATGAYIVLFYNDLVLRAGMPTTMDYVFSFLSVALVLEASRRINGIEISILALLFFGYAMAGPYMPDIIAHRGYDIFEIIEYMYLTTEGIYGTAIGVSSTYIVLFILFGAFLAKSGMGQFFNDFAMAIAGRSRGGPAKVSILSSALLGSINGSAVANVVTTGAFTIPLMKKIGYSKEYAGAVEATASCGGQILPPVMGAAAFIMAEYLGIPYLTIVASAVIPALLYYLALIVMVHFQACKKGMTGFSADELPKVGMILKEKGHLIVPLLILLYLLISGYTPIYAAFFAIVATVVFSALKKETRMDMKAILLALEDGARTVLGVAMSCAVVGLIIGIASLTGFGLKLASAILYLGHGMLLPTLGLTMIACIILGMGLPSIPAYIITVTMAAPALAKLGVEPLVAHMFVFYFGMLANLTPPVALAAFAGAGISGGDPTRTGFVAVRLALAGFIVPFLFVLDPAMLMINAGWVEILMITITATIGVINLGAALEGYLLAPLNIPLRLILLVAALALMKPGMLSDLFGLAVFGAILGLQFWQKKTTVAA
jgi:TRAP transporter 4TM/12TM fusion protein